MYRRIALVIALIFFVLAIIPSTATFAITGVEGVDTTAQGTTIERGGLIEQSLAGVLNGLTAVLRGTGLMPISTMLYNVTPTGGAAQQWGVDPQRWDYWMLRDGQWMTFAAPAYRAFVTV